MSLVLDMKGFQLGWTVPRCDVQDGAEAGEMVEKEGKRLEVLKRRQERELNQLVHYELMRKALQVPCLNAALRWAPGISISILCLRTPGVRCVGYVARQV